MVGRIITRLGPAMALIAVAAASNATAGGMGHGAVMMASGGLHGGGMRGGAMPFRGSAGFSPRWTGRGLPPVSGIIHERAGTRSYVSGFGHTATGLRYAGAGGASFYGHTATALPRAGDGRLRFGGYGHTATALPALGGRSRFGVEGARFGRVAGGIGPRLGRRGRLAYGARGYGGYGVGGYGGYGVGGYGGYGVGGYSGYGADAGDGGYAGTGAVPGAYDAGIYGAPAVGTQAGTYGGPYISETPLPARFAEAPLAPSPGAPYSPEDAYAYAASADSGPAPRIVTVGRRGPADCRCGGSHVEPMVYRYGVGTAY